MPWIFYVILGLAPGASTADIKRAYRRLARRYHPGINPGDRAAEALFQRITEAYETLVDPDAAASSTTRGGDGAGGGRRDASFEFAGFDFSVAAQGAQAATFSELFAEVLHPASPADAGRPEAGADLHATLTVAVRGRDARRRAAGRGDAPGACAARAAAPAACRRRKGRCAPCHGDRQACAGRAGTWCSRSPARRAAAPAGSVSSAAASAAAHGRVGPDRRRSPCTVPPGRADGTRLRIAEQGHAGRQRRHGPAICTSTVHVAPHPLFRRDGDDLHLERPGGGARSGARGARSKCRRSTVPFRLTIPPGTQGGPAVPVERARRADAGGRPRRSGRATCGSCCRQIVDERSQELMREFGRRNNEDVRRALSAE